MIAIDIRKESIGLKCPKCGRKLKCTINDVTARKSVRCPSCGVSVDLTPDKSFKKGIDAANKTLRDFEKNLKKLCR